MLADYTIVQLSQTGKNRGQYFVTISLEDKDIALIRWAVVRYDNSNAQYAVSSEYGLMHRLIVDRILVAERGYGLESWEEVDHVNCNGLDNRRNNLRVANNWEQAANTPLRSTNKSGLKGVSWNKQRKKWQANICAKGRKYHLGFFDDKYEAKQAYDYEALIYHDRFANLG